MWPLTRLRPSYPQNKEYPWSLQLLDACHSFSNLQQQMDKGRLILFLPRLLSEDGVRIFPLLRDCMVGLCHPYSLVQLYSLQRDLAKVQPDLLEYVCFVRWTTDEVMDVWGATDSMGYCRFASQIMETFVNECIAAGFDIVDDSPMRPNGSSEGLGDNSHLAGAAINAISNFLFKEFLAFWYYNVHMARQVLSAFPRLEFLEMPGFLHLPLLAKMKYFFPQCDDESPFAPVSLTPPQMLQNLGITYKEGGRFYSSIMASIKWLAIGTYHYNPIIAVFTGRHWHSDGKEIAHEIIKRFQVHVSEAIDDISDRRKPRLFDVQELKRVMDDPRH
ncbi:hypothetical protein AJ80_01732 [Polytolypa hystricis UAMH7299]|uniref:Uncharacterized protein n=1 Tax=Polytolypa hystricis (strain UAMH7299) TaxID=1447883 RepID=A0A2B7Z053_POLH7|nr:hypothetical protein AJ80_01732 [Polytolypa hystricis UAMH7299]